MTSYLGPAFFNRLNEIEERVGWNRGKAGALKDCLLIITSTDRTSVFIRPLGALKEFPAIVDEIHQLAQESLQLVASTALQA